MAKKQGRKKKRSAGRRAKVNSPEPPPLAEQSDRIDRMVEDLTDYVVGPKRWQGIVESPGVTHQEVGSFFAAAAEFYRQAPWRSVPGDVPIKVGCDNLQGGPWFAMVIGQSGVSLGLALYEDLDLLRQILAGGPAHEENIGRATGLSVTFGEAFEVAPKDLDAAVKYGWPVAGPEAYPSAIRINPGFAFRAPLRWELELLEGCLRAIPDFLARDEAGLSIAVPISTGELSLRLSWTTDA
jgi:hypothetical protein